MRNDQYGENAGIVPEDPACSPPPDAEAFGRTHRNRWKPVLTSSLSSRAYGFLVLLPIAWAGVLSGCTTTHFQKAADKETYAVIAEKSPFVPNMDPDFNIDQPELPDLDGLPTITEADPAFGEAAQAELGARIISLEKALALAVRYNRTYRNQRESLYLSALNLTLDRHDYRPIFSAGASGIAGASKRSGQSGGAECGDRR